MKLILAWKFVKIEYVQYDFERQVIAMAMAQESSILYYVHDEKKQIQMEVLCVSASIAAKQLKPADLNEQVGKLAGIKGVPPLDVSKAEKAPALFAMPEIIIFSGVSNKKLDEFLFSYKNVGLTPTKLKAVITPKNVSWTLYQLIRELSAEHERLEGAGGKER